MSGSAEEIVGRLGSRIRTEREDQGLSVSELSTRSGVGRSTVADIEHASRTPTLDTLAKIAGALGVPMPQLLDERIAGRPVRGIAEPGALRAQMLSIWTEGSEQIEVYRLHVTGPVRRSTPVPGARGHVTVTSGSVTAGPASTPHTLATGDQMAFAADRPHMFEPRDGEAELVLVMRYPREDPAETP